MRLLCPRLMALHSEDARSQVCLSEHPSQKYRKRNCCWSRGQQITVVGVPKTLSVLSFSHTPSNDANPQTFPLKNAVPFRESVGRSGPESVAWAPRRAHAERGGHQAHRSPSDPALHEGVEEAKRQPGPATGLRRCPGAQVNTHWGRIGWKEAGWNRSTPSFRERGRGYCCARRDVKGPRVCGGQRSGREERQNEGRM